MQEVTGPLRRLDAAEIDDAVSRLVGWEVRDGKLRRDFVFAGFIEAIGFMVQAAIVAESLDHHPDWSNAYNAVSVSLETHDVDGLSRLDVQLAHEMNRLAQPQTLD